MTGSWSSPPNLMPQAAIEQFYPGAKEMLLVDSVDSKEHLTKLFHAMYEELTEMKKRK